MHSYINIVSLFNSQNERSVAALSKVYDDQNKLCSAIESVINSYLNEELISGKQVLLKPNWVKQSWKPNDDICLRTNDSFILAVLKVLLKMKPAAVLVGDAPIQGCHWNRMISDSFEDEIKKLSREHGISIQIMDFRRRTYSFIENRAESELRPLDNYLIFDLGKDSWLEEITRPEKTDFRVTNYHPDRMSSAHSRGIHKYCIAKEFFEADVLISLPKIKTHQKTGITGALKNLVGINGDKDFLPHHRIGGTQTGGDCYPGKSSLRYWSELSLDKANRRQGRKSFWYWKKLSSLLWRLSLPGPEHQIAAGWHGNDTTWRMVRDLNIIAEFGQKDGTLSKKPQRQIFSLCDGIVAGQGNGPLEPDPLALGLITFSNNSLYHDRLMASLMGLPEDELPLLRLGQDMDDGDVHLSFNGDGISREVLKNYTMQAEPPMGWAKHIKSNR